MDSPTLSVSILNYQRRETLRLCLERVFAQKHPRFEVLVVDNASTDGSREMVTTDFPAGRLVALPHNVGCAARNAGVEAARAPIVVTIDNDVILDHPGALGKIEAVFAARPRLAGVNFQILDGEGRLSRRDWCHPRPLEEADEPFETDYVLEGACAVRREAFQAVGGYWEPLFLGHEGLDLALRLLDAGEELLYWPDIRVRHLTSVEARPSSRIYYTFTRNGIWIALRHHRPGRAAFEIIKDLAMMATSSVRAGEGRAFARGLLDGITKSRSALSSRRPLSRSTYRRLRGVRRNAPGVLAKARRHLRERPI
jgi:GT2 family glycosyltransferase